MWRLRLVWGRIESLRGGADVLSMPSYRRDPQSKREIARVCLFANVNLRSARIARDREKGERERESESAFCFPLHTNGAEKKPLIFFVRWARRVKRGKRSPPVLILQFLLFTIFFNLHFPKFISLN
jgi:hypothetical protein